LKGRDTITVGGTVEDIGCGQPTREAREHRRSKGCTVKVWLGDGNRHYQAKQAKLSREGVDGVQQGLEPGYLGGQVQERTSSIGAMKRWRVVEKGDSIGRWQFRIGWVNSEWGKTETVHDIGKGCQHSQAVREQGSTNGCLQGR
jgi:hypothetical protein